MQKYCLVVGGSKGIGEAIARKFLDQHWQVGLIYNSTKPEWLTNYPAEACKAIQCDVQDEAQILRALQEFKDFSQKKFHVLVYNSGINIDGLTISSTTEQYDKVLNTNLRGAYVFLREVGNLMYFRKTGRMFFVSSVSATRGGRGQLSYAASKAGLEALVRVGAQELSRNGVMVNGIAPGVIETDMTKTIMDYVKDNAKSEALFERIAMRRVGQPAEVANLIYALSQDEITYITGQILHVDGGYML